MDETNFEKLVVQIFAEKKRGKVLDAGAGVGRLSKELDGLGFEVSACDIDPKLFKEKSIQCVKVDLNKKLPYKNNSFDYICATEVIEHVNSPYNMIAEFNRVLKKNGHLILSTPNIGNIFSRIKFLVDGNFFLFGEKEQQSGHISPTPFWSLKRILQENGFGITRLTTNSYLKLSGKSDSRTRVKQLFSNFGYFVLSPILKPRSKILLKGDLLIIDSRKTSD